MDTFAEQRAANAEGVDARGDVAMDFGSLTW
jgi:hypothetical protein